jgi:hypothetical protein
LLKDLRENGLWRLPWNPLATDDNENGGGSNGNGVKNNNNNNNDASLLAPQAEEVILIPQPMEVTGEFLGTDELDVGDLSPPSIWPSNANGPTGGHPSCESAPRDEKGREKRILMKSRIALRLWGNIKRKTAISTSDGEKILAFTDFAKMLDMRERDLTVNLDENDSGSHHIIGCNWIRLENA